jgi:anti-sigma B factor antagonist
MVAEASRPAQAGVPVVTAPAELDYTNAAGFRAALDTATRVSPVLVADMSETGFCDTAGLHALVAAHKRAVAVGGQLRVVTGGPSVLRIFAITGIDRVIPQYASLDQALA